MRSITIRIMQKQLVAGEKNIAVDDQLFLNSCFSSICHNNYRDCKCKSIVVGKLIPAISMALVQNRNLSTTSVISKFHFASFICCTNNSVFFVFFVVLAPR